MKLNIWIGVFIMRYFMWPCRYLPYIMIFIKKLGARALLTFVVHDILNDTHYDNIISRNYEGLKKHREKYTYILSENIKN